MLINTVTKDGFVSLINKLDLRYQIPSQNYLSQVAIPKIRTTELYISLTVRFLDKDFELKMQCLKTAYLPGEHTKENIARGLRKALDSWHLRKEQLVCITTDVGANVRTQPLGQTSVFWPQATSFECPTRWDSRQKMMERVLEQWRAISDVLSAEHKTRLLVPSWQDLDVLESVNPALHPLQEFTDALSRESYFLQKKEDDTDLTKTIRVKILEYMDTMYFDPATQELLDTASFMDPSEIVQDIKTRVMSEMKETAQKVIRLYILMT
ncbi:hypothetical protein N1851_007839 [Merluccius polli]|uniref:Uncharacterized protein n=1 Tax=Merluccius polli TaxID=89951 RepID=A0AA47N2I9_MERPO|nr:hypothetical protein N1851_007839 [Merluccius polli]